MTSVHDVTSYIIRRCGPLESMKLQKLLYYVQAWFAAWFGRPLFEATIEAWRHGPVVREVYRCHRQEPFVGGWPHGKADSVPKADARAIDRVLQFYMRFSPWELRAMTHAEKPWIDARVGLTAQDRGQSVITWQSLRDYFRTGPASTSPPHSRPPWRIFLEGIGRAMDITGGTSVREFESDGNALAQDWLAVGDDLEDALVKIVPEYEAN